ncbi:MAG: PSD1 and planctomycete cytochrome C domain-containing protein [Planctomycetia bacterium]|nr:PSD1 and planctomycete cytochrome C domain-containing protein [Planctomycetia bacterium]
MRIPLTIALLTLSLSAATSHQVHGDDAVDAIADTRPSATAEGIAFFEQRIQPVLAAQCFSCHSSKAIKVRGGLLLDSRAGVAAGGIGGAVLVANEPEQSRLIEAIRWNNPEFQMPPKGPLTPEQIADFEKWVEMGAPDPREALPSETSESEPKRLTLEAAAELLWALKPVERGETPSGVTESANPIDAFIAAEHRSSGLNSNGPAGPSALLRRVYLDLVGLPPTPDEQAAFLNDTSPDAYEKVVDQLLASEQHGVRYARHWLDVLRYADADERMIAAQGIHLWRDWVIHALNDDVPYDQFVRAQLTGYRSTERTQMSATGYRSKAEPRPDDLFALGLLARGAVVRDGQKSGELALNAVETVSTAFMGLTVGCAKCHDHLFDPITQRDFYAMKALFDPLVPRKITLATAEEIVASGRASQEAADRRAPVQAALNALAAPYQKQLYDDRVAMLPDDVQAVIHKSERERTAAEQKVADDYFPILRIDSGKIREVMSDADRQKYDDLQRELSEIGDGRRGGGLAAYWTVEVDPQRSTEKSFILTSGDPERPELNHEVSPGWPFAPTYPDFREGPLEAFSDWLTAPQNPLFARVAVNRIWQWHFGTGLQAASSDFGKLGGEPTHPELLDWLAAEFVQSGFRMKSLHRLIVTSDAYRRASEVDESIGAANLQADPTNALLWHFPLQRLEAEPIWDSIFLAAGALDTSVGGPSFDLGGGQRRGRGGRNDESSTTTFRRAAYLTRGYSTNRDVMPNFLQAFDVDDGRAPCPQRTQTVTATQGLFMMNSDEVDRACTMFAERLLKDGEGDLSAAVELGYRWAIGRGPSDGERERALAYLENDPAKLKGLAWLLFNLDEFIYVR